MDNKERVRENRLRRAAQRQGLQLVKSRRRDPRAFDFGTYQLLDGTTVVASGRGLDAVEEWLLGSGTGEGCTIDDPKHDHDGIWWSAADELGAMAREARDAAPLARARRGQVD